jgi:acyl-CoA thioester hydrolase
MGLENFRCVMRFRVPFGDVDMLQHVNNAAYVVWAENARCLYVAEVLNRPLDGRDGLILARQEFVYERSLDDREEVAVGCRVARMGRKSFDFAYEIWSETSGYRSAYGVTAMVVYDYDTKTSKAIPEHWRQVIAAYEPQMPDGMEAVKVP